MTKSINMSIIEKELDKVEKKLIYSVKSKNKLLQQESERMIMAGGKRLRPALLLASARFGEYDEDKVIDLAAAIEMLHLATLVHDDVIDESKIRRGVDAVHDRYGNKVAVFTGDFLFTKGFLLVSKYNSGNNLEYLARVIKNICEGEVEQFLTRYDLNVSVTKYLKRIKFKTALLFALSCQMGAQASKCDDKTVKALRNYGMALGTAFQIKDDILDFTGKKNILGKPTGNDLKVGVYTLPVIHALSHKTYGDKLKKVISEPISEDKIIEIIDLVEKSGGIEYSKKMNERYINKAKRWLRSLENNDHRTFLFDLVERLEDRNF